jgi:two-component SAPR family response regulator
LWADSSSQQVRQKFHTTVRRCRDAIGANVVLFDDDRYFVNTDVDIWCDVVEFEALFKEARLTSPLRAHTENLWRRAVDLYRGDLLPSFDTEWIEAYGETLEQMYLDALFGLGDCIRRRGDFQEAISIFQRALEIDPYREDFHRVILTCYDAIGDHSLIHKQVETLKQLLDTDLGITPSIETLTLAQSLLD